MYVSRKREEEKVRGKKKGESDLHNVSQIDDKTVFFRRIIQFPNS